MSVESRLNGQAAPCATVYRWTRGNIPADLILQRHRCEKLRSRLIPVFLVASELVFLVVCNWKEFYIFHIMRNRLIYRIEFNNCTVNNKPAFFTVVYVSYIFRNLRGHPQGVK